MNKLHKFEKVLLLLNKIYLKDHTIDKDLTNIMQVKSKLNVDSIGNFQQNKRIN